MLELDKQEVKDDVFVHSARELWEAYGAPGNFGTWFKQIAKSEGLVDGFDYLLKIISNIGKRGQPKKEVYLTEEAVRKIQLGYGPTKYQVQGAVAARTVEMDRLLANPRLLAQALIDYADKLDELNETRRQLSVLYHSDSSLNSTEIAKDLGLESAQALNKLLIEQGYVYKDRHGHIMPRAHKIPKSCYDIKMTEARDGRVFNYLKWTPEGKKWLAGVMEKASAVGV